MPKINIKAEANQFYLFEHWRDTLGNIISTDAEFEITVISDTILYAVFSSLTYPPNYLVVINVEPFYMGTLSGAATGPYSKDYEGTVTAHTTSDVYQFIYWSNSNYEDTLSTNSTLSFVIKSDTVFTAHFEHIDFIDESIKTETVSIIPNPSKDDFTVSFEVIKPSNIQIILFDLSGREVLDIFNDFTVEGIFSRTVSTSHLSSGVYFLHILIDDDVLVKRVVLER